MRLIDADELIEHVWRDRLDSRERIANLVESMPTIKPQRIKGKWIQDDYYDEKYVCDKCGEPCATYINGKPRDRFCKWCGAEMRKEAGGD